MSWPAALYWYLLLLHWASEMVLRLLCVVIELGGGAGAVSVLD
ncbi:hypothetical protein [Snodgrassella alvi]|nr:hypothetical protein [Snodgrassella alvi]